MEKINYKEVGERLQIRRNQLKMTQMQLCAKLDTTQTHYSNIENGKTGLSIEMLLKLCEALDVTSDYILTGQILNKNESLLVEYYNKLNEKQRHYITQHIKLFYEENLK